jgi:hypothetical protein
MLARMLPPFMVVRHLPLGRSTRSRWRSAPYANLVSIREHDWLEKGRTNAGTR